LNDIGRNSLPGNRKKIAKFLMRTFTYRSTFLYDTCTMQSVFLSTTSSADVLGVSICSVSILDVHGVYISTTSSVG
jgi:hypothetical protein